MAMSINQMMFATVVSIGLLSVVGYMLSEWGREKRQFDQDVAEEILGSTRMIQMAGDMQRLQNEGDYEGARALQEDAMEQERMRRESSPLLKRMEARQKAASGQNASQDPGEPRLEGVFYPEDYAQPEESSLPSAMAVAIAGGGGVLVFGLVGFVAFQALGAVTEEETPAEGTAHREAVADDGDAPDDESA